MKKMTALAAAAAILLALCGCEDTDTVSEDENITETTAPVSVEEVSGEPSLTELTEDDFTHIEAKLDVISDQIPADVKVTDLSGLDFGERLSPCKAPENRESTMRGAFVSDTDLQERIDKPCRGTVFGEAFLDGKLYFSVNYDDICYSHDASVFSYDLETGTLNELVRRTGLDYIGVFNYLNAAKGKLWFIENLPDDVLRINSISPDDGTISPFIDISSAFTSLRIDEADDGLLIERVVDDETVMSKYDPETGEEIVSGSLEDFETDEADQTYYCDGVPAVVTGGWNGERYEPVTVTTQYYTLSTTLNNYSIIAPWKDKVCIASNSDYDKWIYTYDIPKRECIMVHFSGFSAGYLEKAGNGLLCVTNSGIYTNGGWQTNDTSYMFYVLPEIGIAYRFGDCRYNDVGHYNGKIYMLTLNDSEEVDYTYKPDKLYCI